MSEPTVYDSFINADDGVAPLDQKDISAMSLKQLVIYKRQLLSMNELTKDQKEIYKRFSKQLAIEYNAVTTSPTYLFDLHRKKRVAECKSFKQECFKINSFQIANSQEFLDQIELREAQLRASSAVNDKDKHSVYLNTKITCQCGAVTTNRNKLQHNKSAKHQAFCVVIE